MKTMKSRIKLENTIRTDLEEVGARITKGFVIAQSNH